MSNRTVIIAGSGELPSGLAESLERIGDVREAQPKPAAPFRKFTDTRKAEKLHKRLAKMVKAAKQGRR